jgi:hypothetical protein
LTSASTNAVSNNNPKNNQTKPKSTPKTPQTPHKRRFEIPKQNDEGKKLQQMLRRAAVYRTQRKVRKVAQLQQKYEEQYALPRKISDVWARKVCVCRPSARRINVIWHCRIIHSHSRSHPHVIDATDCQSSGNTHFHLREPLGHQCGVKSSAAGSRNSRDDNVRTFLGRSHS